MPAKYLSEVQAIWQFLSHDFAVACHWSRNKAPSLVHDIGIPRVLLQLQTILPPCTLAVTPGNLADFLPCSESNRSSVPYLLRNLGQIQLILPVLYSCPYKTELIILYNSGAFYGTKEVNTFRTMLTTL